MTRITQKFKTLAAHQRKALIPFITAGDPGLAETVQLVLALEKGGADIIELGVPFSDPMADGPVIQHSYERALKHPCHLEQIFKAVGTVREKSQIPLLLMGYFNPILHYGLKSFCEDAVHHGVDAVLVVDLPPEEAGPLHDHALEAGLDLVYLLAPTSDESRIRKVAARASGFIYYVAITGVTGAKLHVGHELERMVRKVKRETALPVCVGFGIATPENARRVATFADGVVIGSALIREIEAHAGDGHLAQRVTRWLRSFRQVLDQGNY